MGLIDAGNKVCAPPLLACAKLRDGDGKTDAVPGERGHGEEAPGRDIGGKQGRQIGGEVVST